MRKVDILCEEKFNGNIEQTIDYIMRNYKGTELNEYVKDFTPGEITFARNILYKVAVERNGVKKVRQVLSEESDLAILKLTKEEIVASEKNPYVAKLGKSLLKLLIANTGVIALMLLIQNGNLESAKNIVETLAIGGTTIYSSLLAMDVGMDLLKYFKFKKLKNMYNKDIEENSNNLEFENQGGKTL